MMKSSFNGLLKDIKIEYSLPEGVIATPIAEPKFIADRKSLTVFTLLKSEEKVVKLIMILRLIYLLSILNVIWDLPRGYRLIFPVSGPELYVKGV